MTPARQVRARYDDDTITVYQAYGHAIADAALAAGTFTSPFSRTRMTWIKPSFLWMMYRCGWGEKPGQERVLAIRSARAVPAFWSCPDLTAAQSQLRSLDREQVLSPLLDAAQAHTDRVSSSSATERVTAFPSAHSLA